VLAVSRRSPANAHCPVDSSNSDGLVYILLIQWVIPAVLKKSEVDNERVKNRHGCVKLYFASRQGS